MAFTWQYYDLLLLGIALSVAVGAAVGLLTPVALTLSVPVTSLVAIGLLAHGLFVRGPVDDPGDLAEEVDALN